MPLSWNEIKARALAFSKEWEHETSEDAEAKYPGSGLADLYDPITMPPGLGKAHQALDKAVDLCYRPQPFGSELARIEFLFGLYEQYTVPMFEIKNKK